jgi:hypothetical protein
LAAFSRERQGVNLLISGEQISIHYEIWLDASAGSPRHFAVDKTPQQVHDGLCCQFRAYTRLRPLCSPRPCSKRMPASITAAGKWVGDTISNCHALGGFEEAFLPRRHGRREQARLRRSLSVPVKLMGDDREVIGRSHMIVYPWNR